MAISAQQLTIYLYSAHRAVIFAIAQLSCYNKDWIGIGVEVTDGWGDTTLLSRCGMNQGQGHSTLIL